MRTFTFKSKAKYLNYLDNNQDDYICDSGYCREIGWYVTAIINGLNDPAYKAIHAH